MTAKSPCDGVRRRAVQILAQRAHGVAELSQKLRQRFPADCHATIAEVVADLQALGYCDDRAFAEMFLRVRLARGFGPRRIALELQQKGIDKTLSQRLLQTIDWQQQLEQQWQAFGFEKDILARQKAKRRFFQRGFPMALLVQVEKHLLNMNR
jgi:regulatory protein